jgi:DNA-binding PadR family transcriptional regulator
MAFEEQTLGSFLTARTTASEILRTEGVRRQAKDISLAEALVMQAASHILQRQRIFFGRELTRFAGVEMGTLYPALAKFDQDYGITTSVPEDTAIARAEDRPPRRYYAPTELGQRIFGLFVPAEE